MKKKTGLQLLGIYYYWRAMHYQYWKSPISKFCFASFYKYHYCALLVWHSGALPILKVREEIKYFF